MTYQKPLLIPCAPTRKARRWDRIDENLYRLRPEFCMPGLTVELVRFGSTQYGVKPYFQIMLTTDRTQVWLGDRRRTVNYRTATFQSIGAAKFNAEIPAVTQRIESLRGYDINALADYLLEHGVTRENVADWLAADKLVYDAYHSSELIATVLSDAEGTKNNDSNTDP